MQFFYLICKKGQEGKEIDGWIVSALWPKFCFIFPWHHYSSGTADPHARANIKIFSQVEHDLMASGTADPLDRAIIKIFQVEHDIMASGTADPLDRAIIKIFLVEHDIMASGTADPHARANIKICPGRT